MNEFAQEYRKALVAVGGGRCPLDLTTEGGGEASILPDRTHWGSADDECRHLCLSTDKPEVRVAAGCCCYDARPPVRLRPVTPEHAEPTITAAPRRPRDRPTVAA